MTFKGHRQKKKKSIFEFIGLVYLLCFNFAGLLLLNSEFLESKDTINMHVNLRTCSGIFKYAGYVMNY